MGESVYAAGDQSTAPARATGGVPRWAVLVRAAGLAVGGCHDVALGDPAIAVVIHDDDEFEVGTGADYADDGAVVCSVNTDDAGGGGEGFDWYQGVCSRAGLLG